MPGLSLHPEKTRAVEMSRADGHFDFLVYRFKRSQRGRLVRLVRSKSLRKLRESIKARTRRKNAPSISKMIGRRPTQRSCPKRQLVSQANCIVPA